MSNASFGGPWTEEKLEILRLYLDAYTTALKNQPFTLTYVDAFAGAGAWTPAAGYESDDYADFTGVRDGSPKIALGIQDKAFDKLVFIEQDPERVGELRSMGREFPGREIVLVNEDANVALPQFCDEMKELDRAVVFLDPYATEVAWSTVEAIARTEKIDCWILFPRMAVNRLMARRNKPTRSLAVKLDKVFGDRDQWETLYSQSQQLSFFEEDSAQTRPYDGGRIANLYKGRLNSVFARVASRSRTLRNSKGSPLFELFFAASNRRGAPIAIEIADHILTKW